MSSYHEYRQYLYLSVIVVLFYCRNMNNRFDLITNLPIYLNISFGRPFINDFVRKILSVHSEMKII
jgi:hypothetical protein